MEQEWGLGPHAVHAHLGLLHLQHGSVKLVDLALHHDAPLDGGGTNEQFMRLE